MNMREAWRELDLVRNPVEWKWLCDKENFMTPAEFSMIVKGDVFVLDAGDTVELVFK